MSREKQIEWLNKLAEDILEQYTNGYSLVDKEQLAVALYNIGCRKQSEVIDEFVERLKEAPIKCGLPLLGLSTKDEIEEYFNDIMLQVRDAIDSIAKEMKGGE